MPFLGELSALLTACCWSGSSLAFAAATRRAGSFHVNVARLVLAFAYLALLIVVAGLDLSLSPTQVIYLAVSGVIGLALGDTFLFRAYREIGPRITMLIMSLAPAMAAALAYFILDEEISTSGFVGITITLAGICIVVLERSSKAPIVLSGFGLALAALAAAAQGAGLIFAKLAFREGLVNGFVATFVRIGASLILLLPFSAATRRPANPLAMLRNDRRAFALTVLGSVLGPFLGITFSLIAIEHTNVGIAATIMAIVPILMLPLVRIIYKERISLRAIAGAVVAVGGVALLMLS
jgi:drug/metabolite transporter (DMT)-like permease